jgi:UDP-N-acetylmuramoylalanine--D-glutamate ligase
MEMQGKKITVVGLGRSGLGAANLLSKLGADVTVTDSKPEEELAGFRKKLSSSVRLALGGHPEDIFVSSDMLVISPGVPLSIPPLSRAREKAIPIVGELELAYRILSNQSLQFSLERSAAGHRIPFLAVTGTNGKSTTTTLLNRMLNKGGIRTILGGNIGNALTEEIDKRIGETQNQGTAEVNVSQRHHAAASELEVDYIVVEVSSFQLEATKDFRPRGAVILNITPDHLDRYHSFDEYAEAKAKIVENQGEGDFLLLNADDQETMKAAQKIINGKKGNPDIFYFSRKQIIEGIYCRSGKIYSNFPDVPLPSRHSLLIDAGEMKIKGIHNLENAMAASAMALLAGTSLEAVRDVLMAFPGLEHRLEFVKEIQGVKYVNDSKGTNVGAVLKSLESFVNPVVLIAGGRDKAGDFSLLRNLVKERVRALVLIGEAREKIKKALGNLTKTFLAEDLTEAVQISQNIARKGDVVLLSPACASFDMFADFEDRGRQFKKIVIGLE